jgi:hypothetical protein
MIHRSVAALLVASLLLVAACQGDERQPIIVSAGRVSVTNLTDTAWTDVEVWLNDYYRAQARDLGAGQRLDVPMDVFIAGYGQRFNPKKGAPYGVQVTAKDANGKPVRLTWGKARWR